jgi:hypothetical protein
MQIPAVCRVINLTLESSRARGGTELELDFRDSRADEVIRFAFRGAERAGLVDDEDVFANGGEVAVAGDAWVNDLRV